MRGDNERARPKVAGLDFVAVEGERGSIVPAAAVAATAAAVAATPAATAAVAAATTAATTVAAATATAATTAATIAAAPAAAFLAWTGFVDGQGPAAERRTVQRVDRRLRFAIVVHLDEAEAARAAGLAIRDDLRAGHRPMLLEQGQQVVGRGVPR